MPFVIGALLLLLLRTAVLGKVGTLVDLFVVFVYFAAFSLWSFGYKLYRYGHDLAPTAAVRVAPFMPPLYGHRKLANFDVYSYPRGGLLCARRRFSPSGRRPVARVAGEPFGPRQRPADGGVKRASALFAAVFSGSGLLAMGPAPVARAAGSVSPLPGTRRGGAERFDDFRSGPGLTRETSSSTVPFASSGSAGPLRGSGEGSVVRVRADGVSIEGFDIDGRGGGDLGRDTSGVHVAARNAVVRNCRIVRTLSASTCARRTAASSSGATIHGIPARNRAKRDPASTSGTRRASRSRATRSGTCATASTSSPLPTASSAATPPATCATDSTTCSRTTTGSKTTSSRTARRARR